MIYLLDKIARACPGLFRGSAIVPFRSRNAAAEHRDRLKALETRTPSREKFRAMLERFHAPDRWLDDDDDWHL